MNKGCEIMKNSKAKKYLLLTGLIVVLVAVGYINFALGNGSNNNVAAVTPEIEGALQAGDVAVISSQDYFVDYKATRESRRDTEIALLDSIITNENSAAEEIKDAQDQKIAIVQSMESELKIEGLLVASGFSDAIVTVQEGSVNVVIKAEEISKEQAAKILEIVKDETGEPAQNIKIILQK
jgi:stage III sporulation protein AH